jgi:bifunctional DNA-binding transcriptional regulator/antitoxin component of YhaV-PrlF toxin-antitoxin module
MKRRFKEISNTFLFLLFVAAPLSLKCCHRYEMEFRKTYDVKPGTKITVTNSNGKIEIEKWDKKEVEVFAVIGSDKSMKELTKVKIEVILEENMEIATIYSGKDTKGSKEKEKDFGIWDFIKWVAKGEYTGSKNSVDYEIKVPDHVVISEVRTTNGKIDLNGIKGPSELVTTNGKIEVENVEGDIEAQSTNGKIDVENVNGFVSGRTTNGKIDVKSEGIKDLNTTNGKIKAEIKKIKENIEIRTTNGPVKLHLPSSLNAVLELSVTNGEIDVDDIPLEIISKHKNKYIKGKMGEGGPEISVSTTNGKIKVRKL